MKSVVQEHPGDLLKCKNLRRFSADKMVGGEEINNYK